MGSDSVMFMQRAFENAVSALCYAFIREHFGARAGVPGRAWNGAVRFVLAQHARMPDYLRLPLRILTLAFVYWSAFPHLGSYRVLDPDRRRSRIARMRRSVLGPFRDLIRFYEGLAIFGFYEELSRADSPPRRAGGAPPESGEGLGVGGTPTSMFCNPPPLSLPTGGRERWGERPTSISAASFGHALAELPAVVDSEIVVIGSGPGGAITACLLAEAGREVTLVESGPFL